MNKNTILIAFSSVFVSMALIAAEAESFADVELTPAEEASPRGLFGKWRIALGAAFNGRISANVGARNIPVPAKYEVPVRRSKQSAWGRAKARTYDGGGYIAPDDLDNGFDTENWGFPVSDYQGNGKFVLNNSYEEVIGSAVNIGRRDDSDSENQFGVSFEVSRGLYSSDNPEHRWGVDLVAAFSYFFQRDAYRASGTVTRNDTVRDGKIQTEAVDPDAMYDYDNGWDSPVNGMYGYGNAVRSFVSPAFGWAGVGEPTDVGGPSHVVSSSTGYNASGDYQELEMLFMLRPWYEITDWWRIFAEAGVGVSWGRFNTSFAGLGVSEDEDFSQWDCYGVAGLGTAFRYKDVDLAFDGLGRFLRDDLDVDGKHAKGTIDRADWGLRLMLGYSF